MNIKELCVYCKRTNVLCPKCKHLKYCNDFVGKMAILTENISPCGLLELTKNLEKYELKELEGK